MNKFDYKCITIHEGQNITIKTSNFFYHKKLLKNENEKNYLEKMILKKFELRLEFIKMEHF